MAKRNLNPNDVIIKIILNIKFDNKMYKDIELDYYPTKTWHLEFADLFMEDNDSWHTADLGDYVWDIQITGENDELGMKNPLHISGCVMYRNENETWSHGIDYLSNHDVKCTNVRVYTLNGKCEKINVK